MLLNRTSVQTIIHSFSTCYRHALKRKVWIGVRCTGWGQLGARVFSICWYWAAKTFLGVFQLHQIRTSFIITQEHIDIDGKFEISASDDNTSFLSTKIQSRHVSANQYECWMSYVEGVISMVLYRCKARCRRVGPVATLLVWLLCLSLTRQKAMRTI